VRHPALVHLPQDARTPTHAERFNRTIQESFVDDHEELLFTDLALFNRKLADWLAFYKRLSARTTPSVSNLRYPSSCNINPSAKGTGLIHGAGAARQTGYHCVHRTVQTADRQRSAVCLLEP
jgi:hypothetical protein